MGHVRVTVGLGVAGVLAAMALSAVALAAPGATSGGEAKASSGTSAAAWTIEADCLACHANEHKAFEDEKCLASKHTALECTDCHADEKGLAKGHKKAKEGVAQVKRLKKSEVDREVCLTCHKQEDLAKATAEQDVLTDKEGTVVNPHDLPAIEDHAGITCASCHKTHEVSESTEKSAKRTCASCHHADVYECYTCHA